MSSSRFSISSLSVVVGVIEIVAGLVSVVIGVVAVTTFSGHPSASAGLWALLFLFSGALSIVAGRTKSFVALSVALFLNIVATMVSSVAALVCILFWTILARSGCDAPQYGFDCDSYHKVFAIIVTMTILMVFLTITSFTGCIVGCSGTCFAQSTNPVIINSIPSQQSTVIISSQSSCTSQPHPSYHPMVPQNAAGSMLQAYSGVPVQTFGFQNISSVVAEVPASDDEPLVNNIVL